MVASHDEFNRRIAARFAREGSGERARGGGGEEVGDLSPGIGPDPILASE
jgi:hypothetical protein